MTGVEASISIASPFLAVPHKYFRPLVKALNGKYSDELHLYTVDCSKVGSLPDIRLKLGLGFSLQYAVTAEKYVAKMVTYHPCQEKCVHTQRGCPSSFMARHRSHSENMYFPKLIRDRSRATEGQP